MKRAEGRETWHRLLEWDKGQAAAEKLAAQILIAEKYEAVDPIHPLGGKDGGKDILCKKDGQKFIAACYSILGIRVNTNALVIRFFYIHW